MHIASVVQFHLAPHFLIGALHYGVNLCNITEVTVGETVKFRTCEGEGFSPIKIWVLSSAG